jgi:glycosyltransferase involved in cell wall biosynthesis
VHILFITRSLSVRDGGGGVASIYTLAKSLAQEHQVTIWTTAHDIHNMDRSICKNCRVQVFQCSYFALLMKLTTKASSIDLAHFDVINVFHFWTVSVLVGALIAAKEKIPTIVHTQGIFLPVALAHRAFRKRVASAAFARRILNSLKGVVVCNMVEVEHSRRWGVRKPIYVLPNAVLPMPARRGVFRRALDLPEHVKVVLYLNRFDPIKRVLELCQAFRKVQDSAEDVVFLLAGDASTSYGREVQAYAVQSGLRAHFLGHVGPEKKWELLADADVLCQYSAQEAHSNALTEALAMGVPVVASHNCNFPLIAFEGAGSVVNSIDEMAEATLRLLLDEDLRRGSSANAFRLGQRYSPEAIAKTYSEIMLQVLSGGRGRGFQPAVEEP